MAADSLVVAGSPLVDIHFVAGSRLADIRLVVGYPLVDIPPAAGSRLVAQVDSDPVPGSDSMTSSLPHFFLIDIDEFTMKDKRIDSITRL